MLKKITLATSSFVLAACVTAETYDAVEADAPAVSGNNRTDSGGVEIGNFVVSSDNACLPLPTVASGDGRVSMKLDYMRFERDDGSQVVSSREQVKFQTGFAGSGMYQILPFSISLEEEDGDALASGYLQFIEINARNDRGYEGENIHLKLGLKSQSVHSSCTSLAVSAKLQGCKIYTKRQLVPYSDDEYEEIPVRGWHDVTEIGSMRTSVNINDVGSENYEENREAWIGELYSHTREDSFRLGYGLVPVIEASLQGCN